MKILLISVNNEKEPYPVAPLGAAYIAKALRDKNHEVQILDLCFATDDFYVISESLKHFTPDVIGLSIRNIDNLTYHKSIFYMPRIQYIVNFIKRKTSVPIIAGGSGFSIFPEDALRYFGLDIGIIGEGETAFPLLLDAFNSGEQFPAIQNICYMKDGRFNANKIIDSHINHFPDRSLLNNKLYFDVGGMANIQSKRGCPFKCSYCTYPNIEGSKLRLREPADVVEELKETWSKYGIDYFFFVDDIFNFPEDHAIALCEEIIRNDLKINWACFATPKGITQKLVLLMKKAGCTGIEFGSDGGSEKTLKGLNKHFTMDDIASAAKCCKSVDLPNAHYIIIGGPDEDIFTLQETLNFFDRISPTAVIALIGVRVYPNTLLHKKSIEEGIIGNGTNLFEPVFYLTPKMNVDTITQKVSNHAKQRQNWIVPGLDIRCAADMLSLLRKRGKRGPLWDMLS